MDTLVPEMTTAHDDQLHWSLLWDILLIFQSLSLYGTIELYRTVFFKSQTSDFRIDQKETLWVALGTGQIAHSMHFSLFIEWLADRDSLMCSTVTMGRQIAKMFPMFSTFSLWGSVFLMEFIALYMKRCESSGKSTKLPEHLSNLPSHHDNATH